MQTEIDQFLTEQNSLLMQQNNLLAEQNKVLSQQIDSLKTILSDYSEVELSLKSKINNLLAEKEAQQALILTLKAELSKLEQGNFSEQLQQEFQVSLQNQLQTQLIQALNRLNLTDIINNLVETSLAPTQKTITAQQTDLQQALLKLSQLKVSQTIDDDLETHSKQIAKLETTLGDLIALISKLNS